MATRENWQEFEGRSLDPTILLGKCLAASDHSAVFETRYGEPQPTKAAIKLIAVDAATAARQLVRVEAAARLSHPGLVRIYRCGLWPVDEPRVLYVLMEYAAENLAEVVPQRALTPEETREVAGTVLDVLGYLHVHGLVHGHLTPSNILAVDDQVKISSDGLTRIGDAPPMLSKDVYYPLEASRGNATAAWDVWALGVTMVQVLTQQLPAWERTAPRKLLLPAAVPERFREIARNCLQDDPHRRWTVERIQEQLSETTSPPVEAEPVDHRVEWNSRRYAMPAAGTGAVLVALGVVFGLTHQRPALPSPAPAVQATPVPKKEIEKGRPSPFESPAKAKERVTAPAPDPGPVASIAPTPKPGALPPSPPAAEPEAASDRNGIVRRVMPNVPAKARNTIQGTVRVGVAVEVDAKGKVKHADLESAGTSRYFAKLALAAARGWKFTPASSDGGNPVRSWILRFEFRRSGTEVQTQAVVR